MNLLLNLHTKLLLVLHITEAFPKQNDFEPRIVGGTVCDYTQHPYAVAIFTSSFCGGTLLTMEWVLTAAHCIKPNSVSNHQTMIRTGFQYDEAVVQMRWASESAVYEKFHLDLLMDMDHPELRYDIGLLKTETPFSPNALVKPAKLPHPGFTAGCHTATVLGIGYDYVMARSSLYNRSLLCVDLPIVNADTCKKTWTASVVDSSIICTMEKAGGKDACKGDSGGPLVCGGVVIGIVSMGKGCAAPNTAATYTRVESYLTFIKKTVNGSGGRRAGWKVLVLCLLVFI